MKEFYIVTLSILLVYPLYALDSCPDLSKLKKLPAGKPCKIVNKPCYVYEDADGQWLRGKPLWPIPEKSRISQSGGVTAYGYSLTRQDGRRLLFNNIKVDRLNGSTIQCEYYLYTPNSNDLDIIFLDSPANKLYEGILSETEDWSATHRDPFEDGFISVCSDSNGCKFRVIQ